MAVPSIRQLEYFVATAESGSFSAASQRLHVSQSALSMSIADLERTLGVRLFLRQPRGVSLTRAGQDVLVDARRLVTGLSDLQNSARTGQASLAGPLVVGCYSTLAPLVLPRVVTEFVARHPDVELSFVEGSHAALQEQLRRGLVDLAILYDYGDTAGGATSDLTMQPILSSAPYVLLHPEHRLAGKDRVPLRQLVAEPLILFDLEPAGEYFRSLFETAGLTPTVRFRTTSYELVRSLVARGLGYGILSQHTATEVSYEGRPFATRPLAGAHRGLAVTAVTLAGLEPTRRARAFIAQCRRT